MRIRDIVPVRSIEENIRWRKAFLAEAEKDRELQKDLVALANEDLLFFCSAFCFTHDPRLAEKGHETVIPFVPYPFQERFLDEIDSCLATGQDLVVVKSRAMGASWCILYAFLHRWLFKPASVYLVVSRNVDYVDKAGDPKSLFWKLDLALKCMPSWMRPSGIVRTSLRLTNLDTGAAIVGESTTGEVGRGGRFGAVMMDEMAAFDVNEGYAASAAVRGTTNCRIYNSTPKGLGNVFYDMAQKGTRGEIRRIDLHWTVHPEYSKDLYMMGGKARSPWYDKEAARCATQQEAGQELDCDFLGSEHAFFDKLVIEELINTGTSPPCWTGDLAVRPDGRHGGHATMENGPLQMWIRPDDIPRMRTEGRQWAIGVDVATGTGMSNSVASVVEVSAGHKVAEYASPHMRPDRFALAVMGLAWMFADDRNAPAMIAFEAPGPGRNFGDKCIECGFPNLYRNVAEWHGSAGRDACGWWPTKDNRRALYMNYKEALHEGWFHNPSRKALSECFEIVYTVAGWITNAFSVAVNDPSGAKENHGDRPTADALAELCRRRLGTDDAKERRREAEPPKGSFAHRRKHSGRLLQATGTEVLW